MKDQSYPQTFDLNRFVIILLLAVLAMFTVYRACSRADVSRLVSSGGTHISPRLPVGGAGAVGIAQMSADKAPQQVRMVITYLKRVSHFRPPKGFRGGRVFRNYEGLLPRGKTYYEYDVRPFTTPAARGSERLVVDEAKAAFYYTRDHYTTFIKIIE